MPGGGGHPRQRPHPYVKSGEGIPQQIKFTHHKWEQVRASWGPACTPVCQRYVMSTCVEAPVCGGHPLLQVCVYCLGWPQPHISTTQKAAGVCGVFIVILSL